jgi:type II secretory pathway component PulF
VLAAIVGCIVIAIVMPLLQLQQQRG